MSTTTQRPTPETDDIFDAYARCACGTACVRAKMQQIERERDEAREQLEAMREADETLTLTADPTPAKPSRKALMADDAA